MLRYRWIICKVFAVAATWALLTAGNIEVAAQMMPLPKSGGSSNAESDSASQLPPDLDPQKVAGIIASMSDEQVRRLLIQELKKQADRQAAQTVETGPTGLAGFIDRSRDMLTFLQARIEFLRSGVDVPVGEEAPNLFTYLGTGEKTEDRFSAIMSVVAVFVASLLITWFFHLYTRGARRRIETASYSGGMGKLGALSLRALLDAFSILILAVATLAVFYFFLERNNAQRVLVASYLAAFAIVWLFQLVSRFLLSPHVPNIRVLPVQDQTAVYLHRWLTALVIVWAFGMLTCGIFRLAGTSEARHFVMVTGVGLLMAAMLVCMIVLKRKQVAAALMEGRPENSLRARMAQSWHLFAIFGVFLLVVFSTFERLLYGGGNFTGIKTLLLVALYFLLDWLLRQALEFAFGLAKKPEQVGDVIAQAGAKLQAATGQLDTDTIAAEDPAPGGPTTPPQAEPPQEMSDQADPTDAPLSTAAPAVAVTGAPAGTSVPAPVTSEAELHEKEPEEVKDREKAEPPSMDRMKHVLRAGLRFTLIALIFFWIMKLWGVSLPVGKAVADAAFDILITVMVCYVAWELISAAIQRRLAEEMPEVDEDMEEGGAGGSRIGTLLLLLRKFMLVVMVVLLTMIILSRLGVNIGPLIAGAGVIGLAIGFGAQTLVRDIISGVFFLIDDAFRVGDYIETGGSKGTVEQLSLRSFKLRHPRGMLYTIPFGDIATVTNLSRDYIITKLDFRVRYDTDVEMVRKLIKKKVYYPIRDNPDLGPKLLDVIKSQGVRELADSAMMMRVKYKTRPGDQFVIRKEVYRLMQEAFAEAGVEFAHRNVTVYMPPVDTGEGTEESAGQQQKIAQAAAAGAAIAQQEEEAQQQQPK